MKENYNSNNDSNLSNSLSLKYFSLHQNKSSQIQTPSPFSKFYRKKFRVQSSSKILSCKQINQQFSQLIVTNRNTTKGLNHAIQQIQSRKQKKQKTFARKFNLLSRKIKKEDQKTQQLTVQIMMLKKQLYRIQKTMIDLISQQLTPSSVIKKQIKKKYEKRNEKRFIINTPIKSRRNSERRIFRPFRNYGVF